MEHITFNMKSLHLFGAAFYDFLRLRKQFFVDQLGWDIPHDDEVEMDQYDNPLAWYSLVLRDGRVVGGARTMATTAVWGGHTYMLRDAVQGKLVDIPADIMGGEVASPAVWECTRLVISDTVQGHADRALCLSLIVDGLVEVAGAQGAARLISLSPLPLMRTLRQLGFAAERIGEPYRNDDGRHYAVLSMPAGRGTGAAARATHRPQVQLVHAPAMA
ncbi:MAG: autoinducer synthase [Rubellimicrobium sp.]|nr:autoinducer synthase [Rubellimicrobium sp.]